MSVENSYFINRIYLHELAYAFVPVLPEESLQCLHALSGQQSVAIIVVIVVIHVAEGEKHGWGRIRHF